MFVYLSVGCESDSSFHRNNGVSLDISVVLGISFMITVRSVFIFCLKDFKNYLGFWGLSVFEDSFFVTSIVSWSVVLHDVWTSSILLYHYRIFGICLVILFSVQISVQ